MISRNYWQFLIAFIAGAANALSFSPFNFWVLGILGFVVLFVLWLHASPKIAAAIGFLFGLGMFSIGVSWIYISIHTFGQMPAILAGFIIFLLIFYLSLYPALCGWLQGYFSSWSKTVRLTGIMPMLWIIFEWLRGWIFTGLPWLSTGYTYLDTALSNYAPIGGVYLVGFFALVSAGAVVGLCKYIDRQSIVVLLMIVGIWVIGWQLNQVAWTRSHGEQVNVTIIQNNVPLATKWNPQESNRIVQSYMQNSWKYLDTDLIIWPEVAVPDYLDNISASFWEDMRRHPADFVFGSLYREGKGANSKYYNSVISVAKLLDKQIMLYRKQHLVPFGEYFPLPQWLSPLFSTLNIPVSDLSTWTEPQKALIAANNRFAVSICYEDSFPNKWRDQVAQAGALINVSEDGWFGDSLAPHQRLQMARFRSRESERFMVRSSNTGLSSIINWKGDVDSYAPQFVPAVVNGIVQPRIGTTPYTVFGDKIALYLIFVLLFLAILLGRKKRR